MAYRAEAEGPPTSTRWAFMADFVERWFQSLKYVDASTSTVAAPRFGTFLVHLPWVETPTGDTSRRKLLFATELVAYMLHLDPATWSSASTWSRPWFRKYNPTRYDPLELVPTMTFALCQMMQSNDDKLDAVQRLHKMLLDADTESSDYKAYATAKQRIFEKEDPEKRLRGFRIPTHIQFQPPMPDTPDQLRSYLQDALVAVRAFKQQCDEDAASPFRLDGVALHVYIKHTADVHAELRELLSLGVPITIELRHGVTGGFISDTIEWKHWERANIFPVLTQNPADPKVIPDALHTLDSKWIANSYELWSAVAYSSSVTKVCIEPTDYNNPALYQQLARWMAYGLAHSPSLRNLEIQRFRMTQQELDALEAVLADPVPSRLIPTPSPSSETKATSHIKMITLKPEALVECHPDGKEQDTASKGVFQTLKQLNIPSDWQFPVVQILDATQQIEFIVPGHAVGATALASVASFHDHRPTGDAPLQSQLTSLVIHNDVEEIGITGRFVHLVGHQLRSLHWYGEYFGVDDSIAFDDDLHAVVAACPALETLAMQDTTLGSLASLATLRLCELSLVRTCVPMSAMVAFFQLLHDQTLPLAQTLQRFTYYCPEQPLSRDAVDAAVEMLATNRRLYSVALGMEDAILKANKARFDAVRQVEVVVETLPLAAKLAFISVVQQYQSQQPLHPIGQLDSGCVASVFQYGVRTAERRIQLFRGDGDEEDGIQSEYLGLVTGLTAATKNNWRPLDLVGDSLLLIRQLDQNRSPKNDILFLFNTEARDFADRLSVED